MPDDNIRREAGRDNIREEAGTRAETQGAAARAAGAGSPMPAALGSGGGAAAAGSSAAGPTPADTGATAPAGPTDDLARAGISSRSGPQIAPAGPMGQAADLPGSDAPGSPQAMADAERETGHTPGRGQRDQGRRPTLRPVDTPRPADG